MRGVKITTVTKKVKGGLPVGTVVNEYFSKTVYNYPSGKSFTKHKSTSEIFGSNYDWTSDG